MKQEISAVSTTRHEQLGLTDAQVLEIYRTMLLARKFDERSLLLQRAGKINFHVSGIGQEAAQVGAAFAFRKQHDYFLPYYRDYAFVLAVGMTARELMLSIFAKAEDPNSAGRQMPGHFGSKRLNIVTGSSPVTTQVPHAAGIALAAKMKKQDIVTYVSFGDGSSNQGDFHEGCNFAGVHKLPVVFVCENNQYAISVPYAKQVACESIADRAIGYGFPGVRVDGNDPLEVYRVTKEAHERAQRGEGPTLIETVVYRISPHSTSDNDLVYRTKEEVDYHKGRDPIPRFREYLHACGVLNDSLEAEVEEEVTAVIKEATEYADRAPFPQPEDTLKYVYGDESV
ncbi:thiamine pyrophosphate-dependent dehydrogenase E1 component subunit alpha [Xylanibacillus composti]|uniref:2-oxoisovalerate dehydrogenase subunit alpha n=1 Tax=Xylanibacillus composti TaxID=1572762 RepID=A0A8J4H1Z0_9BACL|nr:thiamine pyrophosphate-dependent dehydrogenase E1 component subunit alpha [Xylanibacillus composti]MDT9726650.1 thiamine pyrophosphate-dependent dehydrogenase E1 component subunit alpha [Xylanibacillus composti]GIQ69419.1 2-oxoisovalerate dehydrogenase subunit alpha [Xylanibacillus composti]